MLDLRAINFGGAWRALLMTCHVTNRSKWIYALQIVPRRTCKYRSTRRERDIGNIDSLRRDGLNADAFIIEARDGGGLSLACYELERKLILTTSSTYRAVFTREVSSLYQEKKIKSDESARLSGTTIIESSIRLRIRGTVTIVLPGSANRIELNFLPPHDPGKPLDSLVPASGESIKINDWFGKLGLTVPRIGRTIAPRCLLNNGSYKVFGSNISAHFYLRKNESLRGRIIIKERRKRKEREGEARTRGKLRLTLASSRSQNLECRTEEFR